MVEPVFVREDEKTPSAWTTSRDVLSNGTRNGFISPKRNYSTSNDSAVTKMVHKYTDADTNKGTFKMIKRFALCINIAGVIICGSLLINRLSICINK